MQRILRFIFTMDVDIDRGLQRVEISAFCVPHHFSGLLRAQISPSSLQVSVPAFSFPICLRLCAQGCGCAGEQVETATGLEDVLIDT